MKKHVLACLVFGACAAMSPAQTIAVLDDFNGDTAGPNWVQPDLAFGTGATFTEANQRLEFDNDSSSFGQVQRVWSVSVSFTSNWSVQVNASIGTWAGEEGDGSNRFALALMALRSDDARFYVAQEFSTQPNGTPDRFIGATQGSAGGNSGLGFGISNFAATIPELVTLQIAFDAMTKELSVGYDLDGATNGYAFTTSATLDIDSVGHDWGMTDASTFELRLQGISRNLDPAQGLMYFDDLQSSGFGATAVPEPAETVAVLGAAAALGVFWMRRKRSGNAAGCV